MARDSRWGRIAAMSGVAAMAAGLSACGGGSDTEAASRGCPEVLVLRDAEEMTVFRPAGTRPEDVVATAHVGEFRGGCEEDDGRVTVGFEVNFWAERGPAFAGDRLGADYFVSILDGQDTLLAKRTFTATIPIDRGSDRGAVVEKLEQTIPIAAGTAPPAYRVVLGWQLTREQLDYNRARGERRR